MTELYSNPLSIKETRTAMKNIRIPCSRVVLGLVLAGMCAQHASAQTAKATYLFQNNFNTQESGVAALTEVNPLGTSAFENDPGLGRTVYHWQTASGAGNNGGLKLNTTGLVSANKYSLEMYFQLESPGSGGFTRIFAPKTSDLGGDRAAYVFNNKLTIWNSGSYSPPTFSLGQYHHFVATIDPSGKETLYLDGQQAMTAQINSLEIGSDGLINLFLDEWDHSEVSNGKIGLLRLYDKALSSAEVTSIYNNGNPFPVLSSVPEPAFYQMSAMLALGGVGIWRARRRKA